MCGACSSCAKSGAVCLLRGVAAHGARASEPVLGARSPGTQEPYGHQPPVGRLAKRGARLGSPQAVQPSGCGHRPQAQSVYWRTEA